MTAAYLSKTSSESIPTSLGLIQSSPTLVRASNVRAAARMWCFVMGSNLSMHWKSSLVQGESNLSASLVQTSFQA